VRGLSENFKNDLKSPEGCMNPFLKRVLEDDTLCLEIRKEEVDIYYRGGLLFEIKKSREGKYNVGIDKKFISEDNTNINNINIDEIDKNDYFEWIKAIPYLKSQMDIFFSKNKKLEREIQQLVLRENNNNEFANDTDYYTINGYKFLKTQ